MNQSNQLKPITDKILPNAVEIEEIVLGAILNESKSIEKINLSPDDFYKAEHSTIYATMLELHDLKLAIDVFTVSDRLTSQGKIESVGGAYFVSSLSTKISGAGHIVLHSLIIKQKSELRKLILLSAKVQNKAYDEEDIEDITAYLDKEFLEIKSGTNVEESKSITKSIEEALQSYQDTQLKRQKGIDIAINTGLQDLNKSLNGGWSQPDLIVLAARPSMGKTQFGLKFAREAAIDKYVEFISLEMTSTQLVTRYITENEGINFYNIKTGNLSSDEWSRIDKEIGGISKLKLSVSDSSWIESLPNIVSMLRKKKRDGKLGFAIIDYLQLIKVKGAFRSRQQEVAHITRTLKSLARELKIPIMVLAQLARPKDGYKVGALPQLHELREAGDIENDADVVCFIHRPEYYGFTDSQDEKGWKNRGMLIMAKQREGVKDDIVYFRHDGKLKKIFGDNEDFVKIPNNIKPNVEFENEPPF